MSPAESPAIDYKALVQDDRIHASLYTDPRIFADEMDRIFRLVANVEATTEGDGELVAGSNFILAELSVQAKHEMHWWAGRSTHRLRRMGGALRMSGKKVVLVNAAEPLPNLSFLT